MRSVLLLGHLIIISALPFMQRLEVNNIVFICFFFAISRAKAIFLEFPLVVTANKTSPSRPNPSSCRSNTLSNEKSLPIEVIIDELVVNAIAGIDFLLYANLPTNSAVKCCESAALPPFPHEKITPLFLVILSLL